MANTLAALELTLLGKLKPSYVRLLNKQVGLKK